MKQFLTFTAAALVLAASSYAIAKEAVSPKADAVKAEKKGHHGEHFKEADKDGDGMISKAEFMDKAEERFAKMDANGDGSISKEEMMAAKEKFKGKMKDRMKERHGKGAPEAGDAE